MDKKEKNYSQLRAMFAITRGSLRSILRSPSAVVFTIAFPMVFIIAFGGMSGIRLKLDVGLFDKTDTSSFMYRQLEQIPNITIEKHKTQDELIALLKKGKLDAMIGIRKDSVSSNNEIVTFSTSTATRENGPIVKSMLESIIYKLDNAYIKASRNNSAPAPALLGSAPKTAEIRETPPLNGRPFKTIDFVLPGMLGFSILSAGVFGTAFVFFSLRQTLVLKRFFATPIKRTYIVLGEGIARVLFQLVTAVVIIVFGKYVYGFTLLHGVTTALTMIFVAGIGLCVFMGFGFVVSSISPSENVIPVLANIITLPQFLLSGTFFSADNFPSWLKAISNILPLTHLNNAMRKIAFEGASLFDVGPQMLVVAVWGVVIYALAIKFFKWE